MQLSTERVKQYVSKGVPISGTEEYRVLALLKYFYPKQSQNLIKDDRPDLQDREASLGIEITIGEPNKEMKAMRTFSYFCNPKNETQKKQAKATIKKCGAILEDDYQIERSDNSIDHFSSVEISGTSICLKESLRKRINEKVKKISSYKKNLEHLGLAIYFQNKMGIDEVCDVMEIINEIKAGNTCSDFYEFIYVIGLAQITYFDMSMFEKNSFYNGEILSLKNHNEERLRLEKIALMTADGVLTLNDPEWN